jgi:hypothetical protein
MPFIIIEVIRLLICCLAQSSLGFEINYKFESLCR